MLRKRSRGVTSKQGVVCDHTTTNNHNNNNHPWQPHEKPRKPTSFLFNSPRFLKGFFSSSVSSSISVEIDTMMSPTSILDTNPFSAVANFWVVDNKKKVSSDSKSSKSVPKNTQQHSWEQPNNKKGIGLALIDESSEVSNNNDINTTTTTATTTMKQQKRKLVVFGSQLRIQVPPLPNSSVFPCFSPESPREFGIKTPRNNVWPFGNKDIHSHSQVHPEESVKRNGMVSGNDTLSMSEIEQSEDYTCVISHGPNPKTTHIIGDCIVESCCGKIVGSPSFSSKRSGYLSPLGNSIPSQNNFLSFCHHCKKKLGVGRDIFMYRGERAFCSEECRCQEMLFDKEEN